MSKTSEALPIKRLILRAVLRQANPMVWEWEVRVLDIQDGVEDDLAPLCVGGRGAAPPEYCGAPAGYRLMLKTPAQGAAMSDPHLLEAGIEMFAAACPDQPAATWDVLRSALAEGLQSLDRRLVEYGPLQPERFSLGETNGRLLWLHARGCGHEPPDRGR